MFQRGVRTRQQLDFALRGMQPPVRCCSHRDQLVVDTVPYLLELLVPDIRPVSSQLYTPKERRELYKVVAAMIDYNVNYTQERTQDGSFVYNMDPNLEEVGRFKGSEAGRRTVGYAGRQMLSREVEAERLRRTEAMLYKNASEKNPPEEKNKTAGEKKNSVVKNGMKKFCFSYCDTKKHTMYLISKK
ncbi:hypothetical protein AAG570_005984 [Ranatra chinensis]|uniref:Uncharacterized protein n=1 Tax=Ranatra chinensis TaxID=642074 RepID=A0ABD0YIG9_9HEMI